MRDPSMQKLARMVRSHLFRFLRMIRFFPRGGTRDPVILDPGVDPDMFRDIGPDIVEIKVMAYVPVKFPVRRMSRKPFPCRPHLFCTAPVAAEGRNSGRGEKRGIYTVEGGGTRVFYPVGLEDEKTDTLLCEEFVKPGIISAFRQPESLGLPPEMPPRQSRKQPPA